MKLPSLVFACCIVTFAIGTKPALGQADDFDDGDDAGWTRLAPLAGNGIPATFSFPDGNSYRIESAANNVSAALGPPRAGSVREDVSYTDFYVSVNIRADRSIDQNIGILARVSDVGLGTLDGYGVTWNPRDSQMFMTVITNEAGNNIGDTDVFVPDGEDARMVFEGQGANLKLQVFAASDPLTPLATLERVDPTYAMGICGIFNVSDPDEAPTDSTFDNYLAATEEPNAFEIVDVRIAGENLEIEFLSKPGANYAADESEDGRVWNEIDDGLIGALGDRTVFSVAAVPGATRLYRLRRP